ncbi:echinoderm microtubule-associated protein-like 3 isoform X4 [Gallus gallus]|uniref:echinoderm microtubule-associated protein-like 3 isoform X4 n=1 Tax=Gallus gallus TaxID=9031 RepID=UPI001AEB6168|nr:echinoderm microtubule-associated protein-like 3 isoform X4 [Gallus gallus]
MEPFRIPSPHRTPPGPPHPPPRRPPSISVGTQTEETPPAERGGAQEPPPPGSPPCPPPPAPSTSSPEPTTPESPPPTATPSPAPPGARKELLRRHSSSSGSCSPRRHLSRKAASSANLLGSPESRPKEPIMSPGSRRANYNLEGVSVKMFLRGRPITMYVPSGHVGFRPELPPERLQLDWVYGYRGRDSRSNLHVLGSGELIYFIACVVVLLHVPLRRQRHYLRHSDCVRCLAVHPDRLRVATGQAAGVDKDGKPLQPVVHIWDSATLLTLQQIGLGSFERGVGSLAFSCADQGSYLCVVDDSNEHMMSVWDCARGTKLAEVKSTNESVLSVEFNPQDSSSIITSGKSHVYFWTWSGATLTKKQGIFGKYKKPKFIQCFVFDAAGDVLTGDSEGNILTWTRAGDGRGVGKGGKETYQIGQQTRAHEGSVFALCRRRDGTVLSGGGKDRRVLSWSPALSLLQEAEIPERFGAVRTIAEGPGEELLVGTTRNALLRGTLSGGFTAIVQGHTDEVWGLATHPTRCLFLTCGHDRQLCLWDGQEHALAWSLALEDTGLCADFHPGGQVVVVGLLTGRWVVLDTETQQPLAGGSDGNEQLSVVRFSPDGAFLAIGSHDNVIYIYSVTEEGRRYNRFGRCTGHSSFITHLDWSKDGHFIMSNSGDYEILYWDVAGGCKLLRNRFESRDREWASYTCVLGFHVFGVWPDGSDGTDINSLCRSHHERLVAVADDFCKVHLFQYPCARPKAPSHVYGGHGSHVTNVRFTHDDGHLVSLGGKDTGVFQWRVLGGPSPEPR